MAYVQIGGHHIYLTTIIGWFSCYTVGWSLSDNRYRLNVQGRIAVPVQVP